jgi:hypothetical protein
VSVIVLDTDVARGRRRASMTAPIRAAFGSVCGLEVSDSLGSDLGQPHNPGGGRRVVGPAQQQAIASAPEAAISNGPPNRPNNRPTPAAPQHE